jgi:CubicO group peptidase (beta-lactamase class C family)
MNRKKLLFGTLFVGGAVALTRLLFSKPASGKPAFSGSSYDAIDAFIEAQMRRLHIPGASLAIVEGERITHLRGFGYARPGGEVPTPLTPFFIGSITKSFTALAIMQLVEAGKVELDAPVQRYLPWFRVADLAASAQITVRHLLNQTSGLPMLSSQLILAEMDDCPDATMRQVKALSTLKLSHPVGEKCQYCNLNFNILGLIVEAASGEKYGDYIQKHIFDPLEMHHSYTNKSDALQAGLAVGYQHWFSLPFPVPNMPLPVGSLPAGLLISCAEDMAHYLVAQLNGGRYRNVQILLAEGIDEMHKGIAEIAKWQGSVIKYGMGWCDSDIGQTKTYTHGGNLPDFSAFIGLLPEQKKGFIVLFNADPYGLPFITDEIGNGVTALLADQPPPPIKLDFIQWVFRLLPLIPLLQLAGVVTTIGFWQRWQGEPAKRPNRGRMWRQHILFPLIPNLSLAAILIYLQSTGLIRFIHFYMPDLAWILRISGSFATLWAILRTGIILRAWRKFQRCDDIRENNS